MSLVSRINEVTQRRARLVLGWVTRIQTSIYHHYNLFIFSSNVRIECAARVGSMWSAAFDVMHVLYCFRAATWRLFDT